MEYDETLFFKIENYLNGKLSKEELFLFEQDLASDVSLKEMVELHQLEQDGQELLIEKDLRAKMEDWKVQQTTITPPSKSNNKWWLFLGIFLVSGIFFLNKKNTPEITNIPIIEPSEELDSEDFDINQIEDKDALPQANTETPEKEKRQSEKDPSIIVNEENKISPKKNNSINDDFLKSLKSKSINFLAMAETKYALPENLASNLKSKNPISTPSILDKSIQLFRVKEYPEAIISFLSIKKTKNPLMNEVAKEWLAHAYFNNQQFKEAAQIFKEISSNTSMTTKDQAEWYLTLSLVPDYTNQKATIETLLTKMIDPQSYHNYGENARNLEDALNKMEQ